MCLIWPGQRGGKPDLWGCRVMCMLLSVPGGDASSRPGLLEAFSAHQRCDLVVLQGAGPSSVAGGCRARGRGAGNEAVGAAAPRGFLFPAVQGKRLGSPRQLPAW